jgi:cytochrome c oxidase subunit 2
MAVRLLLACVLLGWVAWAQSASGAEAAAPQITAPITGEYGPHLPTDISVHGYRVDRLIHFMHAFMIVLFVGWGIYFVMCLVRYREGAGRPASYDLIKAKPSKWAEYGVIIIEAVFLFALTMPVWASIKNDLPTETEKPVRLRVLAEQFAWNFHYPGPDGKFGKTAPEFVNTATNPAGRDLSDKDGQDDLVSGEMHIPVNVPVICDITSKDVIHSFFVPVLRVKQDAIPGMRIPIWFQTKPGTMGNYEIACAQLCGNNHYSMKALMVVEPSREAFEAWVAEKSKKEIFDESEL